MTPYELPAMVNAHSHAFQRDLRGAGERPRPGARGRRLLVLARGHVRARGAPRPGDDARGGRARLRGDGGGGLRRGRRVPLRPPRARRDAVRRPERDGASPSPRRPSRPACTSSSSPRPTTARASGAAHGRPAPLLRPGRRRRTSPAWTRCARGRTARVSPSASPPTACAPSRRRGWRRSPPTPTRHGAGPPCARARAAAGAGGVPGRARRLPRSSCSTAPGSSARARA